jgi:multiple sugar transport system substrate-binding protein
VALCVGVQAQAAEKPLQYVVHGTAERIEAYKKILAGFTAQSGIPVEVIPVGNQQEKWEKVITLVVGGVPPDIVGGVSTEFGEHAHNGLLLPLDDLIRRDRVNLGQVVPVFLDALKYAGKQYLIPYGSSAMTMFYNRDYLNESGLPKPPTEWNSVEWTYDRFVQYARKLTRRDADNKVTRWGISGRYWDTWISLPYPWGGDWVSSDLSVFEGDKPEAVAALQSLQDLIHREQVMKNDGAITALQAGSAAMAGSGTWYLSGLMSSGINWEFMPWFRVQDTTQAAVNPIGSGILAASSNKENAWKLLKYLTWNADANLEYALASGALPALRVNLSHWARQFSNDANVTPEVVIEQVANHGSIINIRKSYNFTAINPIMTKATNDVVANKKSAITAMQEVSERVNA